MVATPIASSDAYSNSDNHQRDEDLPPRSPIWSITVQWVNGWRGANGKLTQRGDKDISCVVDGIRISISSANLMQVNFVAGDSLGMSDQQHVQTVGS